MSHRFSLLSPPAPAKGQKQAFWQHPHNRTGLAWALASVSQRHEGIHLIITKDSHAAVALENQLRAFAPNEAIWHLPDWEVLPYDLFSPHPSIVSERVATLYQLPSAKRGTLILPVSSLLQRLPPPSYIGGHSLSVRVGDTMNLSSEQSRLEQAGYHHVTQVYDPGDFAIRGSILDVFPMGSAEPYRIELFDEEIESIRSFDTETQRSLHVIDRVHFLPAREFPLDEASTRTVREKIRERFEINIRRCPIYQGLKEGTAPAGIEFYLPLFFDDTASIFDYLPKTGLISLEPGVFESAAAFLEQTHHRYEQRRHDIERPILPVHDLYLRDEEFRHHLNQWPRHEALQPDHPKHAEAAAFACQPTPELPLIVRDQENGAALKQFLANYPGRVLISADSAGRREALAQDLHDAHLVPNVVADLHTFIQGDTKFAITVAPLEHGIALDDPKLCLLTEQTLHPQRTPQTRRRQKGAKDPSTIIRDLAEIAIGAPIVHIDHGVGRYRGLTSLNVGEQTAEFLEIEYAKGDKLYVPVGQLDLVSRYAGTTDAMAPLHSLGGDQWEKAKKKAAQKVRDVAAELLHLQAQRQAKKGQAFDVDTSMYRSFAAGFPFEETPDQAQAIEAVIDDLQRPEPTDRVVCGDVGFGKTEVAMRAVFVAAHAGAQVAVLVPTTLLAEQHYRNFADRFADWPIKVAVLSRFKTKKETTEELARLASGDIDVIVGTHRLLQKDVRFKNLGLMIVDEEQRFGVRQKEALKKLRAQVHLLTLTATPIPRTLNMALSGLRELSIIATPPPNRLAVKTIITRWESAGIREAVLRELARGGQVYFLHNEVQSIERIERELTELLPEARIRVAHGQMRERELEQVMIDFHRQRFNVLLCTTIIESGIDIPNANTIIINRADRFGLSQLHQLRGRVGRSHHRAFAYLVVPEKRAMTGDAVKRMDAMAALDELGAGFALATHDLEIRGAGELLGEVQSGQIAEVGFTLYTELLERAVKAIKNGKLLDDVELTALKRPEVELHLPALIPDDYLPDVHERLTLYQRITSAKNNERLHELQIEMVDRFGVLPDPVKNLFAIASMKHKAQDMGIKRLELGAKYGKIEFEEQPNINPKAIITLIQGDPRSYKMAGPTTLKLSLEVPGAAERIHSVNQLLQTLSKGAS